MPRDPSKPLVTPFKPRRDGYTIPTPHNRPDNVAITHQRFAESRRRVMESLRRAVDKVREG